MTDANFLEAKVRGLENENRMLRSTLWDQYFCAAASALLLKGEPNTATLQAAAIAAEDMLNIRKGRWS